jgi:hypothetical protein
MNQRDNRFYRGAPPGGWLTNEEAKMDEPLLQFFEFGHLPEHLAAVSAPFAILARDLVNTLPRNPERTVALRKLLEAKDCAVRAVLYREPGAS